MARNRSSKFDAFDDLDFTTTDDNTGITTQIPTQDERTISLEKKPRKYGLPGRPKIYEESRIKVNLYISQNLFYKTEYIKKLYRGGRTEYIENLIKKDLEENKERYEELIETLKRLK